MKNLPYGLLLAVTILFWIILFGVGISQDSSIALNSLWSSFSFRTLMIFIATWTLSNVLFLAILASFAGELGRFSGDVQRPNLLSAASRGFFIYLAFIAGQLALNGTLLADPKPLAGPNAYEQVLFVPEPMYFRVVAFSSLLAFMAGYNPVFFSSLFSRIEGFAKQSKSSASDSNSELRVDKNGVASDS